MVMAQGLLVWKPKSRTGLSPCLPSSRLSFPQGLQVRSARNATPRSSWHPGAGALDTCPSLQKRLRNGQHPHRRAPHLAIASTPLFQGQESERTPCLHLLTDVYNAGHCGIGHQHLSIHKTEHLWYSANTGSLRKTEDEEETSQRGTDLLCSRLCC